MSFEGYYQILCKNKHLREADCYDLPNFNNAGPIYGDSDTDPLWRCSYCNELAVWWNLVDITNGSYYENERIDGHIELETASKPNMCTCKCGHVHSEDGGIYTFHIPKKGGHLVNNDLNNKS